MRLIEGDNVGSYNFSNAFKPEDLATLGFTQVGLAFYQGLWSYDGWNNLNYVAEEVKNSKRTVPLAIIVAVPLVTIFYLLVNIAYFAGKCLCKGADSLIGYYHFVVPILVVLSEFTLSTCPILEGQVLVQV